MIKRDIEQTIGNLLRGFPIVTITGPRQSGKTTLAKFVFRNKPEVILRFTIVSYPLEPGYLPM